MILFHVHDERSSPPLVRRLDQSWTAVAIRLDQLRSIPPEGRGFLFEVDLKNAVKALNIRSFVRAAGKPELSLFVCESWDRHTVAQADSLGATLLIDPPLRDPALAAVLAGFPVQPRPDEAPASVATSMVALDAAFDAMLSDGKIDATRLGQVADSLAVDIADVGLGAWLKPIYEHHKGTYRHCLLVTALATAFGTRLGLSSADQRDLVMAALLHDIGKARISSKLLDKPGRLDKAELAIMRQHPVHGHEYLKRRSDVPARVLAAVRHHHEYLDGSGYPDRIAGDEIGDMTRLITIADVFGALIEPRAYKPSLSAEEALKILREMAADGKLEDALVEAFAPVAADVPESPTA